ncbi:alpha/beta hydrolase [Actinoplanes sp. ATCC 53533]|uniref:alpha/beta fold hydrolase n=1 Tax=Actinoplanes sp. ATCC 53533 TaxID=1288362 RepID=UPI000F7A15F6|nr:alpha/beta hydrolase [Actinoplanes sp. ATCC 53533]RSM53357.1 alpha/beta hydrolase [Actinoplanes sp. ATCC 53533]
MSRLFRRPLAVLTVVVGSILGATTLAATSQATDRPAVKPTVVMVHGGWADSSGWNAEIRSLTERGYPVIAPANPLRGLSTDATYIRSVLQTIEGPIVLVGHSYGGAVISNAAVGVPNVKALVYVAAFAPDQGESLAQLVTRYPGTEITPDALVERPYPLDGGGTDLYLKASIFRKAFAGDLPRATTDLMQVTQRPFSVAAFTEGSGEPAWRSVPSWYLLATQDNAIPPKAQEFMATRANAHITRVRASHVPMQSQPQATTELILKAAHATRP